MEQKTPKQIALEVIKQYDLMPEDANELGKELIAAYNEYVRTRMEEE